MDGPTDPSDWKFNPLKDIDGLLRCPICFEYFRTAVMLPACSHNYCSLCIRRFLASKQQCPTCCEPVAEADLKCNRVLDDLVQSFVANRKEFMALTQLKSSQTERSSEQDSTKCECKENTHMKQNSPDKVFHENSLSKQSIAEEEGNVSRLSRPRKMPKVAMKRARSKSDSLTSGASSKKDGSLCRVPEPLYHVPEPPDIISELFPESEEMNSEPATPPLIPPLQPITPTLLPATPTLSSTTPTLQQVTPLSLASQQTKIQEANSTPRISCDSKSKSNASTPLLSTPNTPSGGQTVSPVINRVTSEPGGLIGTASEVEVECPVCAAKMQQRSINAHLDLCLNGALPNPPHCPSLSAQSSDTKMAHHGITYQRNKSLPRLPKIVFSIMNDKQLKKKLKEYHLPVHGARNTLIARLQEFSLQYKAQCDSLNPKSVKEIAYDVEMAEKEKAAAKKPPPTSLNTSNTQTSRRNVSTSAIEEERKNYEKAHGDHFSQLLAGLREKNKCKPVSNGCNTNSITVAEVHETTTPQGGSRDLISGESRVQGSEKITDDMVLAERSPDIVNRDMEKNGDRKIIPESPTTPALLSALTRTPLNSHSRKRKLFSSSEAGQEVGVASSRSRNGLTPEWEKDENLDFIFCDAPSSYKVKRQ